MRIFSEGAEAKLYSVRIYGHDALVKTRLQKKYRVRELDVSLRKNRTRREARVMQRLSSAGIGSPKVIAVGAFSICMEKLNGRPLKDIHAASSVYEKAGTLLAKMHMNDVVHGDFTPANMLVYKGVPQVIDFGLSEISKELEGKAIDLLLMKRAIGKREYAAFEKGYRRALPQAKEVLSKLAEIELRGRYQIRTLA